MLRLCCLSVPAWATISRSAEGDPEWISQRSRVRCGAWADEWCSVVEPWNLDDDILPLQSTHVRLSSTSAQYFLSVPCKHASSDSDIASYRHPGSSLYSHSISEHVEWFVGHVASYLSSRFQTAVRSMRTILHSVPEMYRRDILEIERSVSKELHPNGSSPHDRDPHTPVHKTSTSPLSI